MTTNKKEQTNVEFLPILPDKLADAIVQNPQTLQLLVWSIAASIIIYAVAKSGAELIRAWRGQK